MCLPTYVLALVLQRQNISQKLKTLNEFCKEKVASFFIHILLYSSEKVIPIAPLNLGFWETQ